MCVGELPLPAPPAPVIFPAWKWQRECCNVLREISAAMTPNVTCSAIVAYPNYARDERENALLRLVGMSRAYVSPRLLGYQAPYPFKFCMDSTSFLDAYPGGRRCQNDMKGRR